MATIKEDYVSFETAKLLKEKGFNAQCRAAYTNYGQLFTTQIQQYITNALCSKGTLWDCTAPTIQMVMKWLREIYDLIIYVKLVNDGDLCHDAWGFSIYNKFTNEYIKSDKLWFKYEETCEEAILYCLKNLV